MPLPWKVSALRVARREQRLDGRDGRRIVLAQHEYRTAWDDRRRLDPKANSGLVQQPPGKLFPWIPLARRGDIGVTQDAMGRDVIASEDAAAKRNDRRDLPLG